VAGSAPNVSPASAKAVAAESIRVIRLRIMAIAFGSQLEPVLFPIDVYRDSGFDSGADRTRADGPLAKEFLPGRPADHRIALAGSGSRPRTLFSATEG
jgi:hypothetical protein